jgi:hypothetical protein
MSLIPCRECGKEISTEARACPNCGAPTLTANQEANIPSPIREPPTRPERSSSRPGSPLIKLCIALAIVVGIAYFVLNSSSSSSSSSSNASDANQPPGRQAATASPPPIVIPADEEKFIDTVSGYMASYNAAPNQMAQGAFRPQRAAAICAAFQGGGAISNWVGTISTMTSNNDGNGVLGISLSNGITVSTWNNAVSDILDNTLIRPGTDLLKRVSAMSIGVVVRFSGNFFSSSTDCFEEQSVTLDGSMTAPEFTFRFSDVEPYTSTLETPAAIPTAADTLTSTDTVANTATPPVGATTAAPTLSLVPASPDPTASSDASAVMSDTSTPSASSGSPASATTPPEVVAYDQGHADREAWESWIASLQGPELQGAVFWSGQRSLPNPIACDAGAQAAYPNDGASSAIFSQGCQAAQVKLGSSDARRKSEPLYKAGWNATLDASTSGPSQSQ